MNFNQSDCIDFLIKWAPVQNPIKTVLVIYGSWVVMTTLEM